MILKSKTGHSAAVGILPSRDGTPYELFWKKKSG